MSAPAAIPSLSTAAAKPRGRRWLLSRWTALAVTLGALPYLHTAFFDYVFDDRWTLVHNVWLEESLPRLLRLLFTGEAVRLGIPDATRPWMVVSMWVDRAVGVRPLLHLESALLHGAVVGAAFWLLRRVLRSWRWSLGGALLFAVCTAHVEATAVINYREDLWAAWFLLLCLGMCARSSPKRPWWWDATAALLLMLGLLSKESAVAVVPAVGLLAWNSAHPVRWLARRERSLTLLVAVLVLWGFWRWALALEGDGVPRAAPGELGDILARLVRYWLWVGRSSALPFLPTPIHHTEPSPGIFHLVGGAVAMAAVGGVSWKLGRRARPLVFGVGWMLLTSLPTSPLVGPINEQADRYLLLPSLGATVCWVWLLSLTTREPWRRWAWGFVAGGFLASTLWASRVYRAEEPLFQAAVERAPASWRGWSGLAYVYRHQGELTRAREAAETACRLGPHSLPARVTRAYVYLELGETEKARADIAWVRQKGGENTPGLERASRCLEQPVPTLRACVRNPEK